MANQPSRRAFIHQHKATIEEANRRIAELKGAKMNTPAYSILSDYTKGNKRVRFNRNMPLEELQKSLITARRFVKSKSSTIQGMEEIKATHDEQISDIVQQFGQEGITTNTDELYRVLGSKQWRRVTSVLDSNIVMAYVNEQIDSKKSARAVKSNLTRVLTKLGESDVQDANIYIREKWGI